jgi:hypothetical protein
LRIRSARTLILREHPSIFLSARNKKTIRNMPVVYT